MSNNSSSSSFDFEYVLYDEYEHIEAYVIHWRLFVGIWELITFLVGAPSNALVAFISCCLIRSYTNNTGAYKNHHLCVLSMAIADLLFAVGHCPIMFVYYALGVTLDGCGCRFMYFMTHCSTVGSSLSLLWLNLDKFVCVRYPIRYYVISSGEKCEALIIAGWLASVGWSFFFIYGPIADGFDEACRVYVYEPYVYFAAFVVTFFVLPIALSLLISFYVFVETKKARRFEYPCQIRIVDPRLQKRPRQYSMMELRRCKPSPPASFSSSTLTTTALCSPSAKLRSVTFVFSTTIWSALTLLPYRTTFLVFHFYREAWIAGLAFALFAVMIANAAGNPFITLLTQNQYRDKAKILLKNFLLARRGGKNPTGRRATVSSNGSDGTLIRMRAMTL